MRLRLKNQIYESRLFADCSFLPHRKYRTDLLIQQPANWVRVRSSFIKYTMTFTFQHVDTQRSMFLNPAEQTVVTRKSMAPRCHSRRYAWTISIFHRVHTCRQCLLKLRCTVLVRSVWIGNRTRFSSAFRSFSASPSTLSDQAEGRYAPPCALRFFPICFSMFLL